MNRLLLFAVSTATLSATTLGSPHMAMAQGTTAQAVTSPIAQTPLIEVEVSYLSIEYATLKEIGIEAEAHEGDSGPFTRAKMPMNGADPLDPQALVQDLLTNKKGLIVTSPRVQARSNQQVDVRSDLSGFANVGYEYTGPGSVLNTLTRGIVSPTPEMVKDKNPLALYVGKFQLKTGQGFTATPTLNPDNTINLKILPGMTVELYYEKPSATNKNKLEKVTVMKNNMVDEQTLVNLKDGQPVVLMPNDPVTLNGLVRNYSAANSRYVLLVVRALLVKPSP
jgi:hypothetical protein